MKNTLFRTIKLWVGLLLISGAPIIFIISLSFIDDLKIILIAICVGIFSTIIGLLLLKNYRSVIQLKEKEDVHKMITDLKKIGLVKKIHHTNLTISSRNKTVKKNPFYYTKRMEMIDNMAGFESKKEVNTNEYTILTYKEKKKTYQSLEIKKDSKTLSFLLAKEGTINLYIDPNNDKNYIFDLEFLN